MLCLPLGGVSPYEVLATYIGMAASVALFGMICVAASSYFTRTIAALVVSYLVILPLALVGILLYQATKDTPEAELVLIGGILPAGCLVAAFLLLRTTSRRLLHPPDVGAEAKDVVDPDLEQKMAVGMVIRSDQFPDWLFAPPKRSDLMADRINPIYDKEMRSELFGQGTLMLRLVIQLSMLLALPLMAVCLFIRPTWAPWYTCYVVLFNVLVGPVFSAGSVTSERERQTLELLLTTTVSPWQILTGKLISGLRVSCVLTAFIVWPLLLVWVLPPWTYWWRHADDPRLPGDRGPHGPDDDDAGHVLLGDFLADEREHDGDLRDIDAALRGAGGGLDLRPGVFAGDARRLVGRKGRHWLEQPVHLAAMVNVGQPRGGRLQPAGDAGRRAQSGLAGGLLVAARGSGVHGILRPVGRIPPGHNALALPPQVAGVVVKPLSLPSRVGSTYDLAKLAQNEKGKVGLPQPLRQFAWPFVRACIAGRHRRGRWPDANRT